MWKGRGRNEGGKHQRKTDKRRVRERQRTLHPGRSHLSPPPNLAAVIKASWFVRVDELAAAFKVQTGRPVAATQLEILGMKTAEFRVVSGTRLMSMVHTGVKYDVQYEFGWAPVELPTKVQEWRDRSRAQQEAGQPSAPAGDHPPGMEEEGQSSGLGKWMEQDITVEDVEMTIAVEEERTKNE